jgi:type VI secretion system protein ImpC
MSSFSFGKIHLGTREAADARPTSDTPFRILVLGDFGGSARPARRPIPVDRDNFDEVFARLGVTLRLPLADDAVLPLKFTELDDFHPDRLVRQVELFETLHETRQRLTNPATAAEAAAQVRSWIQREPRPPVEAAAEPMAASPGELLDQLLGEAPTEPAPASGEGDWNALIRRIVAPHLVPREDPEQAELLAIVDEATSVQMRVLLHHPAFQALEAAWRGLHFLVRRLDTDSGLKLFLLDISKEELAADLAEEDLGTSTLYQLLVEQTVGTPGAAPWAVLVGLYAFDQRPADVGLLGRLSLLAHASNAPFLAEARPALVGCRSLAETPDPRDWQPPRDTEAWQALRALPEAAWLGLAVPRVLLRLPYGSDTSPVEPFDFEEIAEDTGHEAYLWGNPGLFCAYLLGAASNRAGWDLHPGTVQEIDGLPLVVRKQHDDVLPCAEVVLTDRAAAAVLNHGIIPLRSVKDREVVMVTQFQSVAEPARPLAGRWQQVD